MFEDEHNQPAGAEPTRADRLAAMTPEEREEFLRLEDDLEADLQESDKQIEAEMLADAVEDVEREKNGLRPIKRERNITTYEGFSGGGVTPRWS